MLHLLSSVVCLQMQISKHNFRKQVVRRCKTEKLPGWRRDNLKPPSREASGLRFSGEAQIDRHRN